MISFFFFTLFFSAALIQSVVFLPVSISPLLLSVMKVKDGLVLLANSAVCVMNESCPPRESEGTVVYTAGYRLMFSYSKVGVNVREDGGGRLSFEDEGRKKGRTNDNRRKGAFGWTG